MGASSSKTSEASSIASASPSLTTCKFRFFENEFLTETVFANTCFGQWPLQPSVVFHRSSIIVDNYAFPYFRLVIVKQSDILLQKPTYINQTVMFNCLAANEVLKLKFRKLHTTVVNNVNPASIINFLFQENVIGANDMRTLLKKDDPQQQCSEVLALLRDSEHPQAFVQLYAAIKEESHLQWLIERVDNFTDQSVIDLLQQLYISEPTGECVLHR